VDVRLTPPISYRVYDKYVPTAPSPRGSVIKCCYLAGRGGTPGTGLLPCRAWGHARYGVVTMPGVGARLVRGCYHAGRGGTPGTEKMGHARYERRDGERDAPKSEARRVGREATTKSPAKARADTSAVCTRGALAAWLGNQMLLPCRAWGHARYGKDGARPVRGCYHAGRGARPVQTKRRGAKRTRPMSTSTSSLISSPPPLLSTYISTLSLEFLNSVVDVFAKRRQFRKRNRRKRKTDKS